jgi:putative DNA primase/helicase
MTFNFDTDYNTNNETNNTSPLALALTYARKGLYVLPLKPPSKVPFDPATDRMMTDWQNRGTTSEAQIRAWWSPDSDLGICIVTGRISGIVAIDVDRDAEKGFDGDKGLKLLEGLLGELPETVEARTPRGGRHLLFGYPGAVQSQIRNATNFGSGFLGVDTHVDIRGDGGQINAAPTVRNDRGYQWLRSPEEHAFAELPPAWVAALAGDWPATKSAPKSAKPAGVTIGEGSRNSTLFTIACRLRGQGLEKEAIALELQRINLAECVPPLERDEVDRIATSAATRYPPNERYDWNDSGNAELFASMHQGTIKYLHDLGNWVVRTDHAWRVAVDGAEERLAVQTVEKLKELADAIKEPKVRQAAHGWARKSGDQARIKTMLAAAKRNSAIACHSREFDSHRHFIAVQNGFVDLRTGQLLAASDDLHFSKVVPAKYDPKAKAPQWHGFLDSILDRPEQELIQTYLGYCLHRDAPKLQKFLLLQGVGANGKSVLVDTILHIFKPLSERLNPQSLLRASSSRDARSDLTKLAGSRLVVASEFPPRRELDSALVKQMTGDEDLVARNLYQSEGSIRITWGFLAVSNPLPHAAEWDVAFWRRAIRIHFDRVIPSAQRDPNLKDTLVEHESDGILAWVVEGAIRYFQEQKLPVSAKCVADTLQWRKDVGTIEIFVEQRCIKDSEAKMPLDAFLTAYRNNAYIVRQGAQPYDDSHIETWLTDSGFDISRGPSGEMIKGLRLSGKH